ncbi:YpdA family putative bacillithiol disulfide reductase [Nonlabens sp. Asnod3-H03]|uniref:YpdA family putative bacillithiol disulfide reductase n=1 Tax=Nonlabens sp. Asnod3-H03 TaxID=3160580 RepID=UPI00386C00A7
MDSKIIYDVIIIGAGPIGLACGLEAQKAGLRYLIIEKGALVNSLYHYPVNMNFFSTSEKLEIDEVPFISKESKPSKQESLEYYRRIATSKKLEMRLYEKVMAVTKDVEFTITTSKDEYFSKHIIIATGFYDIPVKLNIPGEDLDKLNHYYHDPHAYAFLETVVIGASNSAVDAALEIYRKGGKVTMIVRGEQIGDRVKYWVRPDIINRIEEGSIKAHFNATLTRIDETTVTFTKDGKTHTIANDQVLALTGYQPNFEFLKSIGIQLSGPHKIPVYDSHTMETNVKGIYLAGVICGGLETHKWFIENSRVHAPMIIKAIVSER